VPALPGCARLPCCPQQLSARSVKRTAGCQPSAGGIPRTPRGRSFRRPASRVGLPGGKRLRVGAHL